MNTNYSHSGVNDYKTTLENLYSRIVNQTHNYIGYPNNKNLSNSNLGVFLDFVVNNVGDPFIGNNGINTCELEVELLAFFSELFHLEKGEFWGYVTNGGTEGNLYGLYLGRTLYPDAIVVHSSSSHYSVAKAALILNLKSVEIRSKPNGEIDYNNLRDILASLKKYPIIINANIGTTMTGAIDSVEQILKTLKELGIERYYIHCDAALLGPMLTFMDSAPIFDFRLPIGSLSMSGHKFLGSPIPSGMVFTRKKHMSKIGSSVEYIRSNDTTISGSRDGISVLILWQQTMRLGLNGLARLVKSCMGMTELTLELLKELGWPAWKNPFSNIVVIQRPGERLIQKWQLATHNDWSHIILMPGVTELQIREFIQDLREFMALRSE